ncbi:response regulator [uncultured Methanoregula sp.]|uniref:response regulator n=1 Tax=uncultured Methanoregula sp. TaxID=1005933 RepID=UPI002AAAC2DE|nr:response regulator [uncultured Methanoregula sp.]
MTHKILVVEDDQAILDLMDLLIRKLGYEPVLIANGLDALKSIRQDPPSLILLDIMMMPINGWEFLEKLRNECKMKDLPVIIFSASPAVDEHIAKIKDPLLGVLHKPVSFQELRDSLRQHLP